MCTFEKSFKLLDKKKKEREEGGLGPAQSNRRPQGQVRELAWPFVTTEAGAVVSWNLPSGRSESEAQHRSFQIS